MLSMLFWYHYSYKTVLYSSYFLYIILVGLFCHKIAKRTVIKNQLKQSIKCLTKYFISFYKMKVYNTAIDFLIHFLQARLFTDLCYSPFTNQIELFLLVLYCVEQLLDVNLPVIIVLLPSLIDLCEL